MLAIFWPMAKLSPIKTPEEFLVLLHCLLQKTHLIVFVRAAFC
jgi:hypothetical protein